MSRAALLEAAGLRRTVDGTPIWEDLELRLEPGDRKALRGPSGSGKTLLLRTLVGLEPLEAGSIRVHGRDRADASLPRVRSQVMYLPQRIALPPGTVEAAMRAPFGFRAHRDRVFRRTDAIDVLASLGREESFLEKRSEDLSGGEEQIVSFARAVLLQPDVLLLDESTASLDPTSTRDLEERLAQWLRMGDRAYLMTSHDPSQLARMTDASLDLRGAP